MNRPCPCLRCRERRWRPPWGLAGSDPRAPVPPANGRPHPRGTCACSKPSLFPAIAVRGGGRCTQGAVSSRAVRLEAAVGPWKAQQLRMAGVRRQVMLGAGESRECAGRSNSRCSADRLLEGRRQPREVLAGRGHERPGAQGRHQPHPREHRADRERRFLHSRGTSRMPSAPARSAATNPTTRSGGSCDRIPASG